MEKLKQQAQPSNKEINKKLREAKKRVAMMKPLYDNNKHYSEVTARSREPDFEVIDPDAPVTKDDIVDCDETVRCLKTEINKWKRDMKRNAERDRKILQNKEQELKEEIKEAKLVKKLYKQQRSTPEKRAEFLGIPIEDYNVISKWAIPMPENLKKPLEKKINKMGILKSQYIYLLLKKDLEVGNDKKNAQGNC
jgi:hypothetical protein